MQIWANPAYRFRRKITVTADDDYAVPAHYPLRLNLDVEALISAGKLRGDRNDLRIYHTIDNVNFTDLFRDYIKNTRTFFGIRQQINDGESDENHYIYYGNPLENTNRQPSAL